MYYWRLLLSFQTKDSGFGMENYYFNLENFIRRMNDEYQTPVGLIRLSYIMLILHAKYYVRNKIKCKVH